MAPRGDRSLCKRQRRTAGAVLVAPPARDASPQRMQRPAPRRIETCSALRPCLARQVRAPAVAVFLCSFVAAGLWAAPARADETPAPPPPTTTVPDAPPPDPYQAPARTVKPKPKPAPRRITPAVRSAPVPAASTRSYTPPAAAVTPRQEPRASAKPKRKAKVARKKAKPQPRPRAPVETVSLAPLAQVTAAASVPSVVGGKKADPYLWLAGASFAVLALAGLGLVTLTLRFYRPRWS